ncbi:MAG: polysaccharide deacetylase family protein [Acidobacteria bacterium]|nr:polysaccharide deacetylase family protein [Acidobacteriota bacterium]
MYHYVRDVSQTPFPAMKALHPSEFDAQLDWLGACCRVLAYGEFADALEARRPLQGAALLTFDDGIVDHGETVMQALGARGWSGVFFLAGMALDTPPRLLNVHRAHLLMAHLGAERFAAEVRRLLAADPGHGATAGTPLAQTSAVYRYDERRDLDAKHLLNYELPFDVADRLLDRMVAEHLGDEQALARQLYLSGDQIRRMADAGMTFGFHTERHRVLSRLDRAAQREELEGGVQKIRALTGQRSVPMCYPYGHAHTYNADTIEVLAETGYACAFNTVRRVARPECDGRYELPRFDTRDLPPFDSGRWAVVNMTAS